MGTSYLRTVEKSAAALAARRKSKSPDSYQYKPPTMTKIPNMKLQRPGKIVNGGIEKSA